MQGDHRIAAHDVPTPKSLRSLSLGARIVLAFELVLAAAIVLHPLWLAPLLARHLGATSGRSVHFDSVRIGLTPALEPVAILRGVRIANASWAEDARAPFAELGEAVFVFGWLPFEGRHVVRRMAMRDGIVNLEMAADGLRNWRLADPQDRGPGHYWFYALEAHGVTLGFINHRTDLHLKATETDATRAGEAGVPTATATAPSQAASGSTGPAASSTTTTLRSSDQSALPAVIDFDLRWRGVPAQGHVATGAVLTFLQTGQWFAVRGRADVAGSTLDVDGRAADLFRATQIDARATLAGSSLAALAPLIGDRWPTPREYRLAGHVTRDAAGRYAIDDAAGHVGRSDVEGDASWSKSAARQALTAHLRSKVVDAQDLRWLAGRNNPPRRDAAPAAGDPFARLRTTDADIDLAVDRLDVPVLRDVRQLRLAAKLSAGQLTTSKLELGWGGGRSTGRLALDAREPEASAEAVLDSRGVHLDSILPSAKSHALSGTLSGHAALHSRGQTLASLRSHAEGTVTLHLVDGTVSSLLDAELGLEGGKLLRTLISGNDALALPCAAARLDLDAGRARIRSLVIDSANTRITGTGSIDLHDDSLDLLLTPQPKRPGLFELSRSIHVFGPWHKLRKKLVERAPVAADAAADCPG